MINKQEIKEMKRFLLFSGELGDLKGDFDTLEEAMCKAKELVSDDVWANFLDTETGEVVSSLDFVKQ